MAYSEDPSYTSLAMDRSNAIGQSDDAFLRRSLHVKIGNRNSEPIPVTIGDSPTADVVSAYGSVTAVPSATQTTVVTYVVPLGKKFYITRAPFSGTNIAQWKLKKNGSEIDQIYTWFSGPLSMWFDFAETEEGGLACVAGDTIAITVQHGRTFVGDFNARIQGILDNA